MQQKTHRLIYKISSGLLKKNNWNLKIPVDEAMKSCPELIVSLNDSQCLRFIDEIKGVTNREDKIRSIQKQIKAVKKAPRSRTSKNLLNQLYNALYELEFQKDYVCVVMESERDYDRANKGFWIDYGDRKIEYRRFLGTNGGIKNSTIVFINVEVYPEMEKRLGNGRNMEKELVPAKLEAYQALICSGSVTLSKPRIIVVKDSYVKITEDVILINDECDGEPKLTFEKGYTAEYDRSDGYGLMTPEYSEKVNMALNRREGILAGFNGRYAWMKGMIYTFDFVEFAEKVAGKYYVKDVWGDIRDIRDIDVILTESMLKLWDSYTSFEEYERNCTENGYEFSAAKVTPDKLENRRNTNYQFLQSYDFTDEDIEELCSPARDELKDVLGMDWRKSLVFLCGFQLNDDNAFAPETENYIKALMLEPNIINDPFVRKKILHLIEKKIEMCKKGAFPIDGNYAMISGDPYALCQSIFGMEVTGILKKDEVYHKYWIDKGADEIGCFRAPMTCHNNIRKMKLNKSDEAAYWYRYMDTVEIMNDFDTMRDAQNGADCDGDTNMATDNPVILRKTRNEPTIICVQKKADKKVVTEKDIIMANKLAFNDDIGTVTNRVTSMFEVRAGFEKDSEEYKTLCYRIMCGQLYQQNTIDRAKGIIAKPMPEYWFSKRECIKGDKDCDLKVVAARKPYFMKYVYSDLKRLCNEYESSNTKGAIRRFGDLGVRNITDVGKILQFIDGDYPKEDGLSEKEICRETGMTVEGFRWANSEGIKENKRYKEMKEYWDCYIRLKPTGENPCTVNKVCLYFEKEFSGRAAITFVDESIKYDYGNLKTGVEYSGNCFNKIKEIYGEYKRECDNLKQKLRTGKCSKEEYDEEKLNLAEFMQRECFSICSSENELCDIMLDLCREKEGMKQFCWDIVGNVIVERLIGKKNGIVNYPSEAEENGEFEYAGRQFVMKEICVKEDSLRD